MKYLFLILLIIAIAAAAGLSLIPESPLYEWWESEPTPTQQPPVTESPTETVQPGTPDLEVTGWSPPVGYPLSYEGDWYDGVTEFCRFHNNNFKVQVTNSGTGPAGAFIVNIEWAHVNGMGSGICQECEITSLAAGRTKECTVICSNIPAGEMWLTAWADLNADVEELEEFYNNFLVITEGYYNIPQEGVLFGPD